ncbi:hypothetical protein LEMLEM_LOCUS19870, partial [Lemmus lemmus]
CAAGGSSARDSPGKALLPHHATLGSGFPGSLTPTHADRHCPGLRLQSPGDDQGLLTI